MDRVYVLICVKNNFEMIQPSFFRIKWRLAFPLVIPSVSNLVVVTNLRQWGPNFPKDASALCHVYDMTFRQVRF